MASSLVIRRIEAWEAVGLLDPETAHRLRVAEADALPEPAAAAPHPAGTAWALGVTAVELFTYLGAAFVLGAWYALVASMVPVGQDNTGWFGAAGVIEAVVLGLTGVAFAHRGPRFRRAAGVALLAALPNLGSGVYLLAASVRPEDYRDAPTDALVASVVVVVAAVAARRFMPGLTTQLGLAAAAATAGGFAMGWLDATFFFTRGSGEGEARPLDETAALVRVILSMAWWWVVAAGMAVLLVILDPEPRTEGRTRLGRIATGLTAVIGTASAVSIRHDWNAAPSLAGEPVLEPFVGAAIMMAMSGVLVAIAVRRMSVGYLWPGGLGVFIALSWLNAEYLAVESGLWVALLVEAVVLFGVALGVHGIGRRLRSDEPRAPEGPALEAVADPRVTPEPPA